LPTPTTRDLAAHAGLSQAEVQRLIRLAREIAIHGNQLARLDTLPETMI